MSGFATPRRPPVQTENRAITAQVGKSFAVTVTLNHSQGSECKLAIEDAPFRLIGCDSFPKRGDSAASSDESKLVFFVLAERAGTYRLSVEHINHEERVIKVDVYSVAVSPAE